MTGISQRRDESENNLVPVLTEEKFVELVNSKEGNFSQLFYKQGGIEATEEDVYLALNLVHATEGAYGLGITYNYQHHNFNFFYTLGEAFVFCGEVCWLILCALGGLFTGKTSLKDMGGTITTISQVAKVSSYGIIEFLYLIPLLSVNLALFNFLPIPALDGARFVFVLIEIIFRKPVPRKIEGYIHTVGLFVLLALVLFFDIFHFIA